LSDPGTHPADRNGSIFFVQVVDARANAKTRPKASLLVKSDSTGSVGTDDAADEDEDEDDDDDDLIRSSKSARRPKKRQHKAKWTSSNSVQKSSSAGSSRTPTDHLMPGFLDPKLWRRESVCCGTIFRGPLNAIVIDTRYFTPCVTRRPSSAGSPGCSSSSSPSSAEIHLKIDDSSSGSEGSPSSYSPTFERPALSTKMAVPAAL
jgi:Protein Family FAM60A